MRREAARVREERGEESESGSGIWMREVTRDRGIIYIYILSIHFRIINAKVCKY